MLLDANGAQQPQEECIRYLLNILRNVVEKKLEFELDYYLYKTVKEFYDYFVTIVTKSVAGCVWNWTGKTNNDQCGLGPEFLENISKLFISGR